MVVSRYSKPPSHSLPTPLGNPTSPDATPHPTSNFDQDLVGIRHSASLAPPTRTILHTAREESVSISHDLG